MSRRRWVSWEEEHVLLLCSKKKAWCDSCFVLKREWRAPFGFHAEWACRQQAVFSKLFTNFVISISTRQGILCSHDIGHCCIRSWKQTKRGCGFSHSYHLVEATYHLKILNLTMWNYNQFWCHSFSQNVVARRNPDRRGIMVEKQVSMLQPQKGLCIVCSWYLFSSALSLDTHRVRP